MGYVDRYESAGQWLEPGAMIIRKSGNENVGSSLALSGDVSILIASGYGLLRLLVIAVLVGIRMNK